MGLPHIEYDYEDQWLEDTLYTISVLEEMLMFPMDVDKRIQTEAKLNELRKEIRPK